MNIKQILQISDVDMHREPAKHAHRSNSFLTICSWFSGSGNVLVLWFAITEQIGRSKPNGANNNPVSLISTAYVLQMKMMPDAK
jgi:hypothetical protein